MRGAVGDGDARAGGDVGPVGDLPGGHGGHREQLGVGAEQARGHDPVADGPVGDARPDLDDRAGGLVADDVGVGDERAARAVERVASLDRHGLDLHQHGAGGGLGVGDVLVAEDLGRSVAVVDGGLHGWAPRGGGWWWVGRARVRALLGPRSIE